MLQLSLGTVCKLLLHNVIATSHSLFSFAVHTAESLLSYHYISLTYQFCMRCRWHDTNIMQLRKQMSTEMLHPTGCGINTSDYPHHNMIFVFTCSHHEFVFDAREGLKNHGDPSGRTACYSYCRESITVL